MMSDDEFLECPAFLSFRDFSRATGFSKRQVIDMLASEKITQVNFIFPSGSRSGRIMVSGRTTERQFLKDEADLSAAISSDPFLSPIWTGKDKDGHATLRAILRTAPPALRNAPSWKEFATFMALGLRVYSGTQNSQCNQPSKTPSPTRSKSWFLKADAALLRGARYTLPHITNLDIFPGKQLGRKLNFDELPMNLPYLAANALLGLGKKIIHFLYSYPHLQPWQFEPQPRGRNLRLQELIAPTALFGMKKGRKQFFNKHDLAEWACYPIDESQRFLNRLKSELPLREAIRMTGFGEDLLRNLVADGQIVKRSSNRYCTSDLALAAGFSFNPFQSSELETLGTFPE